MRVFKNYFKIVKAHGPVLISYTLIFLIITLFAINMNIEETYSAINVSMYVKDNAQTALSKDFYDFLDKNTEIVAMDEDMVEDNLFYGIISVAVEIPKDFDTDRKVNYKSAPMDMYAMAGREKINQYLNQVAAYEKGGFSTKEASKFASEDLSRGIDTSIYGTSKDGIDIGTNIYFNFLNYLILVQVILIVATIMITYKKEPLNSRNKVSPTSHVSQNLQLWLGHIVSGLCIWAMYMVIFVIIYKIKSPEVFRLLMLNSLVFTIVAVTVAILISKFVKNENALQGILNVVALGSSFLAGAFVPQEVLSEGTLKIAKILPSYYFIKNNNILVSDPNFGSISKNIFIMLIFALGFLVLSLFIKRDSTEG